MDAPKGSREYPFALATQAKWSKNVNSFVNCPDQIIFGSNRWNDCLQLHMAAYLEQWIHRNNPQVRYLFWESNADTAPANQKQVYSNRCGKVIWNSQQSEAIYDQVGNDDDCKGLGLESMHQPKLKEGAETLIKLNTEADGLVTRSGAFALHDTFMSTAHITEEKEFYFKATY
jgi:hypothetical protein